MSKAAATPCSPHVRVTLAKTEMIEKRRYWFIAFFLLLDLAAFGQVKRKDLIGEWTTNNSDSLYYKSEFIELYQDANFRFGLKTCNLVEWRVGKQKFSLVDIYTCTEPARESFSNEKETLKLINKGSQQFLEVNKGIESATFLILDLQGRKVDRYPCNIKVLKLKRI
ncbi:hypothetical protein I2I11_21090 [Pontibacter sp. 172403-2]|nr:hypothetical protein [Pontibacter sp. 172403-2]